jgi:hypothetical protein
MCQHHLTQKRRDRSKAFGDNVIVDSVIVDNVIAGLFLRNVLFIPWESRMTIGPSYSDHGSK